MLYLTFQLSNGEILPLAFALMEKHTAKDYGFILEILQQKIPQWSPRYVSVGLFSCFFGFLKYGFHRYGAGTEAGVREDFPSFSALCMLLPL